LKYYPAFIDLRSKPAVVVGGGSVAERKVRSLIEAGAEVRVISPHITKGLTQLRDMGVLKHTRRTYRKGDLKKAFIVIAGTSSPLVNKKIADEAACLVNVIDVPSEGNFIVPSLVKRGALSIAISTRGASPAISKAIRKEIQGLYGKKYGRYLKFVETVRQKALTDIKNTGKRKRFLNFLASEKIFSLLREKGFDEVAGEISNYLAKETD
jgi:precorrin-2 dehydrogenase/sirohydrochlorin ferrochelatase